MIRLALLLTILCGARLASAETGAAKRLAAAAPGRASASATQAPSAPRRIELDGRGHQFDAGDATLVFEEPSGRPLGIVDAIAAPWTEVAYGLTPRAAHGRPVWLKIALESRVPEVKSWIIRFFGAPLHDRVEFYWVVNGVVKAQGASGGSVPIEKRQLKRRQQGASLNIEPGERGELFVRIESSFPVRNDLRIRPVELYAADDGAETLFFGFYFGILAFAAILGMTIATFARDAALACYALYASSLISVVLVNGGFLEQLFPTAFGDLAPRIARPLMALPTVVATLFLPTYLRLRRHAPRLSRVAAAILAPACVNLGIQGAASLSPRFQALADAALPINACVSGGLLLAVGVAAAVRRVPNAFVFLLALLLVVGGAVPQYLAEAGIVPLGYASLGPFFVGNLASVIVLGVAMTRRRRDGMDGGVA